MNQRLGLIALVVRDYDIRARPPAEEAYGTVAVFLDLYGNRWDLIEPRAAAAP